MKRILWTAVAAAILPGAMLAQPRITGWQNNYSYGLPGTPHYAVAQGSIVVVYGANMAPAGILSQGFTPALNRNLGGVSLKITVAGTTTEAIPYYVSPGQIAAILPSATPAGDGTMTVTYAGQTSAPFAIKVVQSAVGLLTLNGGGNGSAAVYDASFRYVNFTNAANPGQTVIFWGTGNGPDANDETRLIESPRSLAAPFEFYIGGKLAAVSYHGRSSFPGLDQMNVVIPDGVSGCLVSVYVKTGAVLSNFVTIPIATNGRVCSDEISALGAVDVAATQGREFVRGAWYYLGKFVSHTAEINLGGVTIPANTTRTESATAQFLRYTSFDYANYGGQGQPSPGSCVASAYLGNQVPAPAILQFLDPGAVTVTLPDGSVRPLARGPAGYFLNGGGSSPSFIPEAGGTFRFGVTGGVDVGAHTASVPTFTPLTWTNRTTIRNISRTQNLDIAWTGGAPGSYVVVTGVSVTPVNPPLITAFACTAAASDGRLTVPAAVLSSMIASTTAGGVMTGQLVVANYRTPQNFTAPGTDIGWISSNTTELMQVNYQ